MAFGSSGIHTIKTSSTIERIFFVAASIVSKENCVKLTFQEPSHAKSTTILRAK